MVTGEVAKAGGIFQRLGDVVVRWPLLVIGFWIALAAALFLTLPPLAVVAAQHQVEALPADAPVVVTGKQMAEAFHETGSGSMLLVVLTDEKGLRPADEQTYRTLVDTLRQDTKDVQTVQDFLGIPQLREVLQSKDNKVWALPVVLNGDSGTPQAGSSYQRAGEIVKKTVANSTLTANLTGPAASTADLVDIGERDGHVIEVGITVMVLLILLIVYRNPVTMLIPLITIGISVATAQGVLAGLGELGLGITGEVIVFMTGVIFGVGTDYGVFLISRYHDYVRRGADSDQAVKSSLASIGKVIAGSAATVAVTFFAMIFSQLEIFATIGPAISICVITAFFAAVSFLPAVLVVAGRRGWIKPRSDLTHRFWRRSGIRIVRRPKIHLVGSLIVLAILASCASLARYNYDDRKTLPGSVESAVGFAALDRHLPVNSILPQSLFVQSPHDLRTPEALADLELMARRVAQVPDVAMVRGMTRPLGDSLEQTKATWQAGLVGDRLDDASKQIADHDGDLNRLTGGADQLAGALGDVRKQVRQSMGNVRALVNALTSMQSQIGGEKTLKDIDNAAKLIASMRAMGASLTDIIDAARATGPVMPALDASPMCNVDAACVRSREQLRHLVAANDDGTLNQMSDVARQLQSTTDTQSLQSTADGLRRALTTAGAVTSGAPGRLATLQDGADKLADGSRQLADGVQLLVDQTKKMGAGLGQASEFLLGMKHGAGTPSMSGFYIPPQMLKANEFKTVADIFMAPDGHATRFLIQTKLNPFSTAAMDQINSITNAARNAQPNTALADAKVSMAGMTVGLRDTRDYYNSDTQFIVVATIIIVLLILIALLRAIVAPLYLIASVLISYMSALGIGVIVFQFLLGQELHWSAPGLTFILLVAVGADYNLLLISRIREESAHGVRSGVIRTVGSTGAVITSAGLIFAASMFGLTFASISTLVQIGFIIGGGILLDTFLVRTITVPALAALVCRANWWPSRTTSSDGQAKQAPILRFFTKANWLPLRLQSHASRIGREEQPAAPHGSTKPSRRRPRLRPHKPPIEQDKKPLILRRLTEPSWWPPRLRPQVHKPVGWAEPVPTSHRGLTSGHRGQHTRVAVPPTVANRHRHGAHEAHEDRTPHALPQFGTNVMPKQLVTNRLESAVERQMTANGRHIAETNGKHSADTNGEHPVETNGQPPAETNGKQPLETNGQHPAGTNADRSGEMLKARFRADCRNRRAACWRCGQAIDYDAPPQAPTAFEADHYHPVATHPWLAYAYTNLRPSHSKCNRARGSKPGPLVNTPDLAYANYGEHPAETNGRHIAETNGKHSADTNGEHPVETNGQPPAETNGHEPVKTPAADPSAEDDWVNEPRWIGRWPTTEWSFPVDAYDGQS
jgi:putative drug exporter of the RND superfamily